MDVALLSAAVLLTTASIFGRLRGPWTGNRQLLDPGDRVAAGMLVLPIIVVVSQRLSGNIYISLMSPLALYVYAAALAISDRSKFSLAILIGTSAVYLAMLIVAAVFGLIPEVASTC